MPEADVKITYKAEPHLDNYSSSPRLQHRYHRINSSHLPAAMISSFLPSFEDPRNQIRLLRKRSGEQSLDFDIAVWNIDNLPEYHAISYAWGSHTDTATVHIHGESMEVRQNCYSTLRQVTAKYPREYLWIDSVCVDQTSIREKNAQVQMMGDIYRGAKSVLACVGPHADGSELLYNRHVVEDADAYEISNRRQTGRILQKFWRRAYWKRLWIVQELLLAAHVVILCGEHVLALRDLAMLPWRDDWHNDIPGMPSYFYDVIHPRQSLPSLWDAVLWYQEQKCQDPRDHVYAVLSLCAPDPSQPPIKVDYSIAMHDLMWQLMKRQAGDKPGSNFRLAFQIILSMLGLCSGSGISALKTLRHSIVRNSSEAVDFDTHLLAACWHEHPMTRMVPNMMTKLLIDCKAAKFVVGADGRLAVRPVDRAGLRPPLDKEHERNSRGFVICPDRVTQICFDISIEEVIYTVQARVASTARPDDLLLRTGQHVFGDPATDRTEGPAQFNKTDAHAELSQLPMEELVVVRWTAPGLFKVIGQGHITSYKARSESSPAEDNSVCFRSDHRTFQATFSLMSNAAYLVQWTHCNILLNTPEDERSALLDDIVSQQPAAFYFYFPRDVFQRTYCRKHSEDNVLDHYHGRTVLPPPDTPHAWFSEHAQMAYVNRLYALQKLDESNQKLEALYPRRGSKQSMKLLESSAQEQSEIDWSRMS